MLLTATRAPPLTEPDGITVWGFKCAQTIAGARGFNSQMCGARQKLLFADSEKFIILYFFRISDACLKPSLINSPTGQGCFIINNIPPVRRKHNNVIVITGEIFAPIPMGELGLTKITPAFSKLLVFMFPTK